MSQSKAKADPKNVARRIDAAKSFNYMVDEGREFASRLYLELRNLGWRPYQSASQCGVALFEGHLMKKNRVCEVLASCLFGMFTDVTMYVASQEYLDLHKSA